MAFQIIRNDITKVKADAIVNTANPAVAVGDGVDSAIYKAAGKEQLFAEREKIGYLEPGSAAVTSAFNLDAKYIIHVSGPWWKGGKAGETETLRKCYDKALMLAAEKKCESVAFPLLATGTYGFPQKLGMEIAVDAFTSFLEEHEMEILLVVFGEKTVRISGELGEEVASFIDEEYVSEKMAEEYRNDGIPKPAEDISEICFNQCLSVESVEERYTEPPKASSSRHLRETKMFGLSANMAPSVQSTDSLEEALKGIYKESFEKHLQMLINKKGLKNSEVYATANISKQYFSKLLKGAVKPSKEKVLALAVGLRLNMDETVDFMRLAGYALSPISQTDTVVSYFIEHKIYNVIKIDIVLFDYGLDPLSNGC